MNIYRITILFIALSQILTSCKKEEEKPREYSHDKIGMGLYPFLFDVGSYWVYKDTITNETDSTVVISINRSTFINPPSYPGQGSQGDVEYFNIKYFSLPSSNYFEEQLFGSFITRALTSGGCTYISGKDKGSSISNAEVSDVFDSLNIEGDVFLDVVKMKVNKDSYIDNNYNLYYVDSIGVVKKELTINDTIVKTWNLIRYNTVLFPYEK